MNDLAQKESLYDILYSVGSAPDHIDREVAAFPRYADRVFDPSIEHIF
jgi:hypothetical protein